MKLKKWTEIDDLEYIGMLKSIYEDLYLRPEDSDLYYEDDDILDEILELTDGLLGKIIWLLRDTATKIIEEGHVDKERGEIITIDLLRETAAELEMIDWKKPEKEEEESEE